MSNLIAMTSKEIQLKTYLVSYTHEGAQWVIELKAASEMDARSRLGKLVYGQVDGELVARLPVQAGLLAKAMVFLRNAFRF
jgi:hypothetical protein